MTRTLLGVSRTPAQPRDSNGNYTVPSLGRGNSKYKPQQMQQITLSSDKPFTNQKETHSPN